MSTNKFMPTVKYGLVITSSDYKVLEEPNAPKWDKLPNSKNDGKQIKEYLEKECHFEYVYSVYDKKKDDIEKQFEVLSTKAKNLQEFKVKALFFIYYSGHGTFVDADTHGHTVYGEPFNLDAMVREISVRANSYVIAMFDCCREKKDKDGNSNSKSVAGGSSQSYTIYSAGSKQKALSQEIRTMSEATESFLAHVRKVGPNNFPICLQAWPAKAGRVEIKDKTCLTVDLGPQKSEITKQDEELAQKLNMEKKDVSEMRNFFKLFDSDNDGTLSYKELLENMKYFTVTEHELKTVHSEIIADLKDENIDLGHFILFMKKINQLSQNNNSQDNSGGIVWFRCPSAIPARAKPVKAYDYCEEEWFIVRARPDGPEGKALVPGITGHNYKGALIPYNNKQMVVTPFEILMDPEAGVWKPGSSESIPEDAIIVGHDADSYPYWSAVHFRPEYGMVGGFVKEKHTQTRQGASEPIDLKPEYVALLTLNGELKEFTKDFLVLCEKPKKKEETK